MKSPDFDIKPSIRLNKIYQLIFNHKINKNRITFKDSYLLLPHSLSKLLKSFNVEFKKGIFPYNFVNKDNLDYIGPTPDRSYFNPITDEEYNSLLNDNWNLKKAVTEYIINDVVSLHAVLKKFAIIVFEMEGVDALKALSLPQLSYKIFKTNYMKHKIVNLTGMPKKLITESYYGGSVEVYEPYGENLYYYDMNSLYPTAMLMDMPVGLPSLTTNTNINELFGYVDAVVEAPNSLHKPLLPYRHKGLMITPVGR